MGNSVRSRPNRYETLGLTPEATDDEIRQAFARKMSECRWELMGASAQICIAYETLGNRFKRVDYDRSNGLEPKPQPRLSTMAVTQQRWVPFIASVPTNALGQAASDVSAKSRITSLTEPEVLPAPDAGPIVADQRPRPQERRRTLESLDSELGRMPSPRLAEGLNPREPEERLLDWKRPALAVGGFVLAAGLIGAFAGLSLKDDEASAPAAVAAPASRPQPKAAGSSGRPFASSDVNEPTVRFVASEPRGGPIFSKRRTHWRVRHRAVKRRSVGSQSVNSGLNADQAVTEAPVSQPIAADVPHSTR